MATARRHTVARELGPGLAETFSTHAYLTDLEITASLPASGETTAPLNMGQEVNAMDPQARIQAIIDNLVEGDVERGLQVAAYYRGELVVDAWSGLADVATGHQVDGETLFTIFSTSKGVVATVIHLLAERRKLDYDAPIAEYWPAFAANGKAAITVRHVLTHTAGVPQLPEGVGVDEMCDWERTCEAIAGLSPLWEPGSKTGYHAMTFGWILGEVARRVDGRAFARIVQEDVCRPLGITSLYFGIPDEVEPRVATLEGGRLPDGLPPDALFLRAMPECFWPLGEVFNRPSVRRACIPAGGGIANARSIARLYAALAGDVSGAELLPRERVRAATTEQTADVDLVLGGPITKALGFWIGGDSLSPMGERASAFGHGGAGGSMGFADPEHHLAFGLAKTRLLMDAPPGGDAAYLVAEEARAALGISPRKEG